MMKVISKKVVVFVLLFCGVLVKTHAYALSTDDVAVDKHRQLGNTYVAFPIQTYFVPLPEESMFKDMFYQINPKTARPGIVTMISMAISTDNTVIWYDHWEDGYENDSKNYTSPTSLIWGDGNAANGCSPVVTVCTDDNDKLYAGNTIVLQNTVALPRNPAHIVFDGGDRIQASYPIAITRGAYPEKPGSLMAGAVEVLDTDSWGLSFEAPLGMDIGEYFQAFQFSAFFYMAGSDDTILTLQDGSTIHLNRGEGGVVRVNQQDKLVSNKKIQVDLITGDVWSYYELRWYSLLASEDWSKEYVSSVGDSVGKTKVLLYNPNPDAIEVSIDYLDEGTTLKTVNTAVSPGKAVLSHVIPTGSGAWFNSTQNYIALSLTDTEFTTSTGQNTGSQWYDWGFPVVPRDQLTAQVLIGWGYGCTDNNCYDQEDRSVVWISPVQDADIFVDYSNIGMDYDMFQMKALESRKVNDDGDHDMTGAVIFATEKDSGPDGPSVDIAAAWGQDPAVSKEYQGISLDLGTVVLPFSILRVTKNVDKEFVRPGETLTYTIRISNVGNKHVSADTLRLFDTLDEYVTYIEGSSTMTSGGVTSPFSDDSTGGTRFPLDEAGHLVAADIIRRGGTYDFSFEASVDEYEHIRTFKIVNVGLLETIGGGIIPYEVEAVIDFQAQITIINKVYLGHDSGESCGTNAVFEKVQGDVGDTVTYCFEVTNTGESILDNVVIVNEVLNFTDTSIGTLAPGASVMIPVPGLIIETNTNTATVSANPVFSDGSDIPELLDVVSSDPSGVDLINHSPNINIENTVYLGNDEGSQCGTDKPQEKVEGLYEEDVVYCFTVTNTGDTHLNSIVLDNVELSFTDTASIGQLAPGASATVHFQTRITGSLTNYADVTGNPVTPLGLDLVGVDDVIDSDPSEVTLQGGSPSVKIVNKVYLGNDDGASCSTGKPVEKVEGYNGEYVVYCFTVTNTGGQYLGSVTIDDIELAFSDNDSVELLAPGATAIVSFMTTINGDLTNNASVHANPVNSEGVDMVGFDDVTDSDPSEVAKLEYTASINIENTVYLGHDSGQSCNSDIPTENVAGPSGAKVTYCLKVTNTGDIHLGDMKIDDTELGFSAGSGSFAVLAPGASTTVAIAKLIRGNLDNNAKVSASPVSPEGEALQGAQDVTDTDPSAVSMPDQNPSVTIENTVYLGTDGGASCGTDKAVEKVEGYSGDYVTYCFKVTNTGDTFLASVTVYVSQLSFTDLSAGLLAPGASALVIYAGVIDEDLVNLAQVAANPVSPTLQDIAGADDVTDSDPSEVAMIAVNPSIKIVNKVYLGDDGGASCDTDKPVEKVEGYMGDSVVYCFTVTNTGNTILDKVALNDTELDFQDDFTAGVLAPGDSITIPMMTTIDGDLTNNAIVTAIPVTPGGVQITRVDEVKDSDPSEVEKLEHNVSINIENTVYLGHDSGNSCGTDAAGERAAGYTDGAAVTYCFEVTNTGQTHLNNVRINDEELSFEDQSSIGLLAPGASAMVYFQSEITVTLDNVASVSGHPVSADGDDLPGTEDVTDTDPSAVIRLADHAEVQIENTVYRGEDSGASCGSDRAVEKLEGYMQDDVTYCLRITNSGNEYLNNVRINDEELSFQDNGSIGLLAPGATTTITVSGKITQSFPNTATVTATPMKENGEDIDGGAEDVTDSDPSEVVLKEANPSVKIVNKVYLGDDEGASCDTDKPVEKAEGYIGTAVVYCFTVTNAGDTYLDSVTINDTELDFTDDSTVGVLAPGDSITIPMMNTIDGDLLNNAAVTANPVGPDGRDLIGVDDVTDSDPSEVAKLEYTASINIENTVYLGHNVGEYCSTDIPTEEVLGVIGADVTYCFEVTNTGDTYLNNITVADQVLSFTDSSMYMLPPGGSAFLYTHGIITGKLQNVAYVVATPVRSNGGTLLGANYVTDSDLSQVDKAAMASIKIENTVYLGFDFGAMCETAVEKVEGKNGDDIVYCFKVTNTGSTHLKQIVIDDADVFLNDNSIGILGPGESEMVPFSAKIGGNLTNVATVTANPVTAEGMDIAELDDVTDSDPSEVVERDDGDNKVGEKPPPVQCLQENEENELVCATKEVYLDTVVSDIMSCVKGEQVLVNIDASIHFASGRYDIGWYVATDGGDSLNGTCVVNGLQEGTAYSVVAGPGSSTEVGYVSWSEDANGDNDSCGDVVIDQGQSGNIDIPIIMNTPITCSDENDDGSLDFSICFTWRSQDNDGHCNIDNASTVTPGDASSCFCTRYDVPTITVNEENDDSVTPCR